MTWVAGFVLATALAAPRLAVADAACAADAAVLRHHLEREQRRVARWNTGWAIAYGGAVVIQLVDTAFEYKPFGEYDERYRDTLYVGAIKATVGVGARLVLPLRIHVPAPVAEPCAERDALRAALADAGRRERTSFYLNHIGGFTVNAIGAAFLWQRDDLETAALSLGTGIAAGILAAYTQPRLSWHWWREQRATWTVSPTSVGVAVTW